MSNRDYTRTAEAKNESRYRRRIRKDRQTERHFTARSFRNLVRSVDLPPHPYV